MRYSFTLYGCCHWHVLSVIIRWTYKAKSSAYIWAKITCKALQVLCRNMKRLTQMCEQICNKHTPRITVPLPLVVQASEATNRNGKHHLWIELLATMDCTNAEATGHSPENPFSDGQLASCSGIPRTCAVSTGTPVTQGCSAQFCCLLGPLSWCRMMDTYLLGHATLNSPAVSCNGVVTHHPGWRAAPAENRRACQVSTPSPCNGVCTSTPAAKRRCVSTQAFQSNSNRTHRSEPARSKSAKLVALTAPVSHLDVDKELWELLDLCTDHELETVYNILFGPSPFSPVVKSLVKESEPCMLDQRGRSSIMHKVTVVNNRHLLPAYNTITSMCSH